MIELRFDLPYGLSANRYWRSVSLSRGAGPNLTSFPDRLVSQLVSARDADSIRSLLRKESAAIAHEARMGVRNAVLLSTEAREYRDAVAAALMGQNVPRRSLAGDLRLELLVHRPNRQRRDLSNLLKPLEDALVHAKVVEDDVYFASHALDWVGNSCSRCHLGPYVPEGLVHVVVIQRSAKVEQETLDLGGAEPPHAKDITPRISAAEFRKRFGLKQGTR